MSIAKLADTAGRGESWLSQEPGGTGHGGAERHSRRPLTAGVLALIRLNLPRTCGYEMKYKIREIRGIERVVHYYGP